MARFTHVPAFKVCSFNCRSVRNSMHDVVHLCNTHDFVLLQEHWLIAQDLPLLNSIHPDFLSYGLSAVDVSTDILVGRPYGGTAILYKKAIASSVQIVPSGESRITCIQVDTNFGILLLVNVYMPTNYGDSESLCSYVDCLAKLQALILETNATNVLIAGDFNCNQKSSFFSEFENFRKDNEMIASDMTRLGNINTYFSDDGTKVAWIDHVLASQSVDNCIKDVCVLADVISSDHRPLSFAVCGSVCSHKLDEVDETQCARRVLLWSRCDDLILSRYQLYLDNLLQNIPAPDASLLSGTSNFDYSKSCIDKLYSDITSCVQLAINACIPTRLCTTSEYNMIGWNEYVEEKHNIARAAFVDWLSAGKPKSGCYYDLMRVSRAKFKLAVRYCKNNIDQLKADACADAVLKNDSEKFWKSVYKINSIKATNNIVSVGGVTGSKQIADMWQKHFTQIYSNNDNSSYRAAFEEKMKSLQGNVNDVCISLHDVSIAFAQQKLNKACGPDGIHVEAYVFGCHRLYVNISLLFNLCVRYGYLPNDFMTTFISPLAKCASGDLTDVHNYRAISLSNTISKVLETVLLKYIECSDQSDDYQFGFKKKHSTALCTAVFKRTVKYYTERGSHVFCAFIDFNKAFDNVDYWLLFYKLCDVNNTLQGHFTVRLLVL